MPNRAYRNLPGSVGARGVADSGFTQGYTEAGYAGVAPHGPWPSTGKWTPQAHARRKAAQVERWQGAMQSILAASNAERELQGEAPLTWNDVEPKKRARIARRVWERLTSLAPVRAA